MCVQLLFVLLLLLFSKPRLKGEDFFGLRIHIRFLYNHSLLQTASFHTHLVFLKGSNFGNWNSNYSKG